VSPSTVSRALSVPHKVDPGTRERVLRVAEHLGYQPNRAARSLITGRTGNLGLLLPDLANPFFPSLVKAVQHQAHRSGYQVLMMDTDEDPAVELAVARALARQVDGLILCSPRMRPRELREAAALGPAVLVNRGTRQVPAVVFDNLDGMRQVVTHLAGLGHDHLGFAGGPRSSWSNTERLRTLRLVTGQQRLRLAELGNFAPTAEGGRGAADSVLLSGVTAVLGYNDLVAAGLCQALAERGIGVPADLSVVGIDDSLVAGLVRPRLTTLALRSDVAGRTAVDLLLQLLGGQPPARAPRLDVPAELVVRESTGPPCTASAGASRRRPARRTTKGRP
jgi:DNA-binding LacI/PurR family transcriptional regulator